MSLVQAFINVEEYVFLGNKNNYYPKNTNDVKKDVYGNILLGKFLEYDDVRLHGDILSNAKAIFEYGTVDSGQYHNVINMELACKKNI